MSLVGSGPVADFGLFNGERVPGAHLLVGNLATVNAVANTPLLAVIDSNKVRPFAEAVVEYLVGLVYPGFRFYWVDLGAQAFASGSIFYGKQ